MVIYYECCWSVDICFMCCVLMCGCGCMFFVLCVVFFCFLFFLLCLFLFCFWNLFFLFVIFFKFVIEVCILF